MSTAVTEAERRLIEAALAWRKLHGPALYIHAMTNLAKCAEVVLEERSHRNPLSSQAQPTDHDITLPIDSETFADHQQPKVSTQHGIPEIPEDTKGGPMNAKANVPKSS